MQIPVQYSREIPLSVLESGDQLGPKLRFLRVNVDRREREFQKRLQETSSLALFPKMVRTRPDKQSGNRTLFSGLLEYVIYIRSCLMLEYVICRIMSHKRNDAQSHTNTGAASKKHLLPEIKESFELRVSSLYSAELLAVIFKS